jgi:HNH endonuclease
MLPDSREELRRLYQFCCGYCGTSEVDIGAALTVDHFHPRSHGEADDPINWVYCYHACNEFKGEYWQPGSPHRILHPLHDDLSASIVEEADGRLRGLTETGVFHIQRLHLNRPQLIAPRLARRINMEVRRALVTSQQEEAAHLQRLAELEAALQAALQRLAQMRRH